jgi:1-acyl-sn-glycerol-3-phosphate acyltransferase
VSSLLSIAADLIYKNIINLHSLLTIHCSQILLFLVAMITLLKKFHAYFYRFNVGLIFILMYPFLYYFSRKPERYIHMNKLRTWWGILSSLFSGIIYKFEFEQPIDWSRTYIICPNHISNLDITMASILAKNDYSFLGKDELLDGFVTKLFFKTVDIPVNRLSNISSFKAFKKAGNRLKEGASMIIFPEGTIAGHYPPKVIEFKNGPFRLAIDQQVPIIPVTSLDTWDVYWDEGTQKGSRPGICHIFVHEPIETIGMNPEDTDALRDRVHDIISKKFEQNGN